MNTPPVDAHRFGYACLLGVGLGLLYGALRPFRQRHPHWADTVFVAALFWCWLYFSFAICRGDLRLSYSSGLLLGCLLEEYTLGRLLRPVFAKIWKPIFLFFGFFFRLPKKFFKKCVFFVKFLFATGKKWVTIN